MAFFANSRLMVCQLSSIALSKCASASLLLVCLSFKLCYIFCWLSSVARLCTILCSSETLASLAKLSLVVSASFSRLCGLFPTGPRLVIALCRNHEKFWSNLLGSYTPAGYTYPGLALPELSMATQIACSSTYLALDKRKPLQQLKRSPKLLRHPILHRSS